MSGNSGTGGPGPLTEEGYRWALAIIRQATATTPDDADQDDQATR